MSLIVGVEFITVDKRASLTALRALRARLRGRRFDAPLHMQLALRSSLVAHCVPAAVKPGFDRARAPGLQWLFTNPPLPPPRPEPVLGSFFGLLAALGLP